MLNRRNPRDRFFTRLIWAQVALALVCSVFAVSVLGVGDGLGSPPTMVIWVVVVLTLQYLFIGGRTDENNVFSFRGRAASLFGLFLLLAPPANLVQMFFFAFYDGILVLRGGFPPISAWLFLLPALIGWGAMLLLVWKLSKNLHRYGVVRLVFLAVLGSAVWHAALYGLIAWVAGEQFQIQSYEEEFGGRFIVTRLDGVFVMALIYAAVALPWAIGVGAYLFVFNPARREGRH